MSSLWLIHISRATEINVNACFCGLVDSSSTDMEDSFYLSLVWQVRLDSKNCQHKSKVLFMLKQIQDRERERAFDGQDAGVVSISHWSVNDVC